MNKSPQKLGLSLKPFVRKIFSVVVVFIVLWSLICPLSAWASVVPITVEVDKLKSNTNEWGSTDEWDFGFVSDYPDIAVCIDSDYGSRCFPGGTSIKDVKLAECKDSLTCTFNAKVPPGEFKIWVIDVDFKFNDLISVGFCAQGKICNLGKARVQIGKNEDEF